MIILDKRQFATAACYTYIEMCFTQKTCVFCFQWYLY